MANRRPQMSGNGGRRPFVPDSGRVDQRKNFSGGRGGVSPWQGGGPGGVGLPNLLPLGGGGSTEATLALANNILNLLQPRPNPVPSLLDMPIRRDFVPNMGRFDRSFPPQRMGNQGNFRRTGNYNRAGERINNHRNKFKSGDGPRQQNKSSPKKEADSKAKPVKESESEEKPETKEPEVKSENVKKVPVKTRFDEIHPSLLKCHICNKSMWDGRSFDNHLSGRAHAIMMQKTAESYALTADTMRQEFKIRDMKRTRKTGQQPVRDFYCAMCDMYAKDGGVHRTTVGHRKLKKYLHPTCTSCHKEMPTRIELDEHRLTAEHLKNMQDKQEDITKPKPEVMVISTISIEQTFLREDRQRKRQKDKPTTSDNVDENGIKKEPGAEGTTEEKPVRKPLDTEKTIIDMPQGTEPGVITPDMLPAYSTERGVGASFLSEYKCVQCSLCNKLLDGPETAEVHLRTWKHHQLFLKALQPLQAPAKPEEADASAGSKRPHGSSNDGNWKRRRNNTDTDGDADSNVEPDNSQEDVSIKKEPEDATPAAELTGTDGDMPNQDELEDWEQSVDEILDDEKNNSHQDDIDELETSEDVADQTLETDPDQSPEQGSAGKPRPTRRGGRGHSKNNQHK